MNIDKIRARMNATLDAAAHELSARWADPQSQWPTMTDEEEKVAHRATFLLLAKLAERELNDGANKLCERLAEVGANEAMDYGSRDQAISSLVGLDGQPMKVKL